MMSTLIVAIYELTSPLYQYMASHKNKLVAQFWAIGPRKTEEFILFFMTFLYLW